MWGMLGGRGVDYDVWLISEDGGRWADSPVKEDEEIKKEDARTSTGKLEKKRGRDSTVEKRLRKTQGEIAALENVAGLELKLLWSFALRLAGVFGLCLTLLVKPDAFDKCVIDRSAAGRLPLSPLDKEDIEKLGPLLVKNEKRLKVMACGRLACTKKTDGLLRLVYDGSSANTKIDKSLFPKLRLPGPKLIAGLVTTMSFVLALDFKNWFYQFPAHTALQQLSAVQTVDGLRLMAALPMGLVCSPVLAHVAALCVVLWRHVPRMNDEGVVTDKGEDGLGVEDFEVASVPDCIWLKRNGVIAGCILVYLDNVYVFTTTSKLLQDWHTRIVRNCKMVHALVKGEIIAKPVSEGIDVLGAEYAKRDDEFVVRVASGRLASWPIAVMATRGLVVCKVMARAVAIVLYSLRVRGVPLNRWAAVMDVGRKAARAAAATSWNHRASFDEDDISVVNAALEMVQENAWTVIGSSRGKKVCRWASDATLRRWSVVCVDADGPKACGEIPEWIDAEASPLDIFTRELYAVLQVAMRAPSGSVVVLACDNEAVVAVVSRGYTHTRVGRRILALIHQQLLEKDILMKIFWIPSDHNIADVGTRPGTESEANVDARLKLTQQAFEALADPTDVPPVVFTHANDAGLPDTDTSSENAWKEIVSGLAARDWCVE